MSKDYGLRRKILTAMTGVGKMARLSEVAVALGPDWLTPAKRAALRQMVMIMVREGLILRMQVGVFRSLFGVGWGGMGTREQIIECISACLQECDGVAPMSDLLEVFADSRIWGPSEQDQQGQAVRQIIAGAGCFRQYLEGDQEYVGLSL